MPMNLIILKVAEIDNQVPGRIQIVPLGQFKDGSGKPFVITPELIGKIIAEFNKRVNDVVIDYEHQTLEGVEAPAAGWIQELEDAGPEGLWAKIEWTPRAAERIRQKEYRYLSPVFFAKKNKGGPGLPFKLHSAALTNDPAIDGMVPLINKLNNPEKENPMDEHLKKLIAELGLADDATTEVISQAVCKLKKDFEEAKAATHEKVEVLPEVVVNALDLKPEATASEAEATIIALKHSGQSATDKRVDELKKDLAQMKAEKLVNSAMEAGKISAAQREWAQEYAERDLEGFQVFVSKAPRVVPTEQAPKGPDEDKPGKPDEATLAIAKQFGNSEEDLVKFGGLTPVE